MAWVPNILFPKIYSCNLRSGRRWAGNTAALSCQPLSRGVTFKNMKNETIVLMLGILWLVLSSSYIPHLIYYYPFRELKGVRSLSEEVASAPDFIKEAAGVNDKTQKEIEESLTRALRIAWVESLLLVIIGLLAGVFLLKKKKSGRIIALFLAAGLLLLRLIYFLGHWDIQSSAKFWTLFFRFFPLQAVQDITSIIVLIVTILVLFRPSIAAQFRRLKHGT